MNESTFDFDIDEAVRQYLHDYPDPNGPGFVGAEAPSLNTQTAALSLGLGISDYPAIAAAPRIINSPNAVLDNDSLHSMSRLSSLQILPNTRLQHLPLTNDNRCLDTSVESPHPDFKFESRATIIQDRRRVPSKASREPNPDGIKCTYPGCKYRRTFGRPYELQRHMKKHSKDSILRCPITDCDRSYYRFDKMRDHLSSKHNHNDDEEAICPFLDCNPSPMPLDVFVIHIKSHHWREDSNWYITIQRTLGLWTRSCPISSCSAIVQPSDIQRHILLHDLAHRIDGKHAIRAAGYDATTVQIICPVCTELCETQDTFISHLERSHLFKDFAHYEHYTRFLQFVREDMLFSHELLAWESWFYRRNIRSFEIFCPCCFVKFLYSAPRKVDHHLGLLRDPSYLRPYRRAILKLYPNFASHPVFNDVKPQRNEVPSRPQGIGG